MITESIQMNPTILYGCVFAVAIVILIVVTLMYAFRSSSWEESAHHKTVVPVIGKKKRDEKSNNKREKKKHVPQTSRKENQPPVTQSDVMDSQPASAEGVPVVAVTPAANADRDRHGHDRVEFKVANEIVLLDEVQDQVLSKRKVTVGEKPKKPILTKRSDASLPHSEDEDVATQGKGSRANSFDVMMPKDEYELIKTAQKTRDQQNGQVSDHKAKVKDVKRKGKSGINPVQREYHFFPID